MSDITCPYCKQPARFVTGREVYPHRRDLWTGKYYLCRPCGAWVGTHKKTGKPFGRLANFALRTIRSKAHAAFDPIWKEGPTSRKDAYWWLSRALGIEFEACHIGDFDQALCQQVIDVCQEKINVID
jgi:hypothetical protein